MKKNWFLLGMKNLDFVGDHAKWSKLGCLMEGHNERNHLDSCWKAYNGTAGRLLS